MRGRAGRRERAVTLSLGLPLGLPAKWIGEESLRIALYKRLATADGIDALDHLAKEVEDRYGTPPAEFARLLGLSRLRLLALDLGVRTIQRRGAELAVTLDKGHRLDPDRFLSALKAKRLTATGPDAFRVPELFLGLPPDSAEVCGVAGRFLVSLARPGALTAPGLLAAFSGGPS